MRVWQSKKVTRSSVVFVNLGAVHLLKHGEKALSAHARATLSHHSLIELIGQGDTWDGQVHFTSLIQHDAKILDKVLDVEARLKVASQLARAEVLQLEAAGTTLREQFDHLFVVETGLLRI